MNIFSSSGAKAYAWGPTASVSVRVPALGGVVDNSWILVGCGIDAREIADVRQCFNDVSYIYAMGNRQSYCQLTLTFVVMIGQQWCSGFSDNFSAISAGIKAYRSRRISKHPTPNNITIGGMSRRGWLVGINVGNLKPQNGTCIGTATFLMQL